MKLLNLLESLFNHHPSLREHCTCHVYSSVVRRVVAYCGRPGVSVQHVFSKSFLAAFEKRLRADGLKENTISSYMNSLRALYREALRLHAVSFCPDLFDDVFTGTAPTAKRAVAPAVIADIVSADLSCCAHLSVSRDLFVLSLLLHGMPFVDLAHLLKSSIQGDVIVYRRRKTSGTITVPILPNARLLLEKYASCHAGPYVLCLLDPDEAGLVPSYETVLRRHNRHLEELSGYLGLAQKLSSYVSRHSWATIAHHNDVDVSVVSQAMGHHTETVTRTYLSSFSYLRLRQAGCVVFDAVVRSLREKRKKTPPDVRKFPEPPVFTMKTGCFAVNKSQLEVIKGTG